MYSSWSRCNSPCGTQRRKFSCRDRTSRTIVSVKNCKGVRVRVSRACGDWCAKQRHNNLFCDFENHTKCSWKNDRVNDQFDWSVGSATPSHGTGPHGDRNTVRGHFAYIESSLPRRTGDVAVLSSPPTYTPKGCLSFWYHMKGTGMGELTLRSTTHNSTQILFTKKGDQGRVWIRAEVSIEREGVHVFSFHGVCGKDHTGDIAIDDIKFHTNPCPSRQAKSSKMIGCREKATICSNKRIKRYCHVRLFKRVCCRTCSV